MEILTTINDFSALGIAALAILVLFYFIKSNKNLKKIGGNDLPHIREILKEIRDKIEEQKDTHNQQNIILNRIIDKLNYK